MPTSKPALADDVFCRIPRQKYWLTQPALAVTLVRWLRESQAEQAR